MRAQRVRRRSRNATRSSATTMRAICNRLTFATSMVTESTERTRDLLTWIGVSMSTRKIATPADTQRRAIEATVHCLVEYGYSWTMTQRIQERRRFRWPAAPFPKPDMFVVATRTHRAAAGKSIPGGGRINRSRLVIELVFAITILREAISAPQYLGR